MLEGELRSSPAPRSSGQAPARTSCSLEGCRTPLSPPATGTPACSPSSLPAETSVTSLTPADRPRQKEPHVIPSRPSHRHGHRSRAGHRPRVGGRKETASSHRYAVSITGEQITDWSYSGRTPGSCGGTTSGSGRQELTLRSTPKLITAARAGLGRTWVLGDSLPIKAQGTRTGQSTQSPNSCGGDGYLAPGSTCGTASYTIDAALTHGLDHPAERLNPSSAAGNLGGAWSDCPWFVGPTDSAYLDQNGAPNRGIGPSADAAAGLRFSFQRLASARLAAGRSFDVAKRTSKLYMSKDAYGGLQGHTELRWTIHFQARG